MPLFNLSVFTPTPNRDEQRKKKTPLKICCMLFFDGTLNSKENIQQRELHEQSLKTGGAGSAIYLKNRVNQDKEERIKKGVQGIDLKDDSYENDYSNIVLLETNTEQQQPGFDETVVVYTEGSGTVKYEEGKDGKVGNNRDRLPGYAFSAASTGIKAKVERGINQAIEKIGKGPNPKQKRDNKDYYIEKLTIDVHGFSRGAASARYCVHELLRDMATVDRFDVESESVVHGTETNIQRRLWREHWLDCKEVEVRFVGLFDTVASYYGAQSVKAGGLSLENWLVKLKAISHDKVKKVVHLASAEEHRNQFSLHNIKSALDKGIGEEYFLPGVHSDVGGGYLPNGEDGNLIVFQGAPDEAERDRAEYLEALGWFKKEQLAEKVTGYYHPGLASPYPDIAVYNAEPIPTKVELRVKRRNEMLPGQAVRVVHNAYRLIPLRVMAEKVLDCGVKVKPNLEMKVDEGLDAFAELKKLESRIRTHMSKSGKRGSAPDVWLKVDPELNAIRHKHLHFSARYNGSFNGVGHNPMRQGGKRKRYVFNG